MKKEKKVVKADGKKTNFFKKHKKGLIILGILLLVVGGVGACVANGVKQVQDLMSGGQYATTTLEERNITNSVSIDGTIATASYKDVAVAVTNTDIAEIRVEIGDVVKEGDIIAVLDSTDIEESLEEAKQSLLVASSQTNSSITSAADSLATTQENADINEERTQESIDSAYADYASAGATEATALTEYNTAIAETNAAKTAYDSAVASTAAAQTAYDAAMLAQGVDQATFDANLAAVKEADADSPLVYAWDTVTIIDTSLPAITPVTITVEADLTDENKTPWTEGASTVATGETNRAAIDTAISALRTSQVSQATYDAAVALCTTEQATLTAAETNEATLLADYNTKKATSDQKKATYDSAKATREAKADIYQSAAESLDDLERSNESTIETQQDNLDSSRLSATTATTTQENQVEMYEEQLEACIVKAPFDGTITALNFEEGDTYTGQTLLTIQNAEELTITADVSEYDISDIQKGMAVVFKTDTTGDEEMFGQVTFVSPVPNVGTGTSITYPIEITISDPNERLRLGMTAQTNVILDQVENVFAVPYECVKTDEDGNTYINVLVEYSGEDETTAEMAELGLSQNTEKILVEVGLETDYYTEIRGKDLEVGMEVQLSYLDTSISTEEISTTFGPGRN